MVGFGVDIDAMGRKELQGLAKTFGIKANQKSVVLREMIRRAMAFDEQSSPDTEETRAKDQGGQPELKSLVDDNSKVFEDTETNENKYELNHSIEAKAIESTCVTKTGNLTDEHCQKNEVDYVQDANTSKGELMSMPSPGNSISETNEFLTVNRNESDDSIVTAYVDAVALNETERENVRNANKFGTEETLPMKIDKAEINTGSDHSKGKQTIEKKRPIQSNEVRSVSNVTGTSSTKISFSTDKSLMKKFCDSKVYNNEKFASKLDRSFRKSKALKEARCTNQPIEERSMASTAQKREVPLWKVHSRDFIRKRGPDKNRDSHPQKKNSRPSKHVTKRPFSDRSNNNMERNIRTTSGGKDDIRRIPPISKPMSKRNEQQIKLILERQSVGRKDNDKLVPPKPQAMSKRNEEQMKRFVERQLVGRKNRAKREEVKKYANYVRS